MSTPNNVDSPLAGGFLATKALIHLPKDKPLNCGVCPDPNRPRTSVKSAEIIRELSRQGQLPRFSENFGKPSLDGLGDCFEISYALLEDIARTPYRCGWRIVEGVGIFGAKELGPFRHWWLEHDGWAIEAANGKMIVFDAPLFYRMTKAKDIVRWERRQMARMLKRTAASPTIEGVT